MKNKLEKYVFLRINDLLRDSVMVPDGNSLWITSQDMDDWYFEFKNDGRTVYNGKIFAHIFAIFCFSNSNNTKHIKSWIERNLPLQVRVMNQNKSDLSYILQKLMKKNVDWDLENRYGFSIPIIKKYFGLKTKNPKKKVKLMEFISN